MSLSSLGLSKDAWALDDCLRVRAARRAAHAAAKLRHDENSTQRRVPEGDTRGAQLHCGSAGPCWSLLAVSVSRCFQDNKTRQIQIAKTAATEEDDDDDTRTDQQSSSSFRRQRKFSCVDVNEREECDMVHFNTVQKSQLASPL